MEKMIDVYAYLEPDTTQEDGYILAITSKDYFDKNKDFDDSMGRYFKEIEKRLNSADKYFVCEEGNDNEVTLWGVVDGVLPGDAIGVARRCGINLIFDNEEFNNHCRTTTMEYLRKMGDSRFDEWFETH